jgi:[protein-PII] uridylyltransferase
VEEGFRVVGDHLEIPHAAHLRERPVRLLRAFAVAQAEDVPLSRTALRLVRENLGLVDDAFRADPAAAAAFFEILAAERRVFRTLTALNEEGVLGAFLPEWEHLVCRWQHVMYHTYTVDVHTTFLVEQLRRLWRGKYERALPGLTDLVRSAEDRLVLFLGCLLHDVGKGWGGDHSRRGAEIARRCLERLGLEPGRRERVVFLVAQHLVMSHVAQRRDLADPKVIVEFARLVGDRENLRNLYLLTFADTRASSPEAWTDWKGRLLRQLFERTSEFLETGGDDPARALEQVEAELEARQADARAELRGLGLAEARSDDFFATLPRRYFVSHDPREIARHARLVLRFDPAQGVALAVREVNDGSSELLLCTRDVHGLYAMVAGTLASRGLNILGSNVYTTRAGLALEVYRVATPPGGEPERRLAWQAFEATLREVLAGTRDLAELIRQRRRPLGRPQTPARHPPSVKITNAESDFYTILDVAADDRLGLLYDLTRTLADHGCEIYISKATTILDQVADTFYVKDAATGKKLRDRRRVERLREALLAVASAGPEGAGG